MVKNLPSNAGNVGSVLGQGTKISHAKGQPSPRATTRESQRKHRSEDPAQPKRKHSINRKRKKVKSLSCVRLLVTPWTVAYEAPLFMGFFRQEYWSVLPLEKKEEKKNICLFCSTAPPLHSYLCPGPGHF